MENRIWKKEDELTLVITDLSDDGNGIGHVDGYTLFVKDSVIGDEVKVKIMKAKKNYAFARLIEVVKPSPDRVVPVCPIARQCGGCQMMFTSYEGQVKFKRERILNCLTRIGHMDRAELEQKMDPLIENEEPYFYRNKALFPVGMGKDGKCKIGFYAGRTHSIIDTKGCYLQGPGSGQRTGKYEEETGTVGSDSSSKPEIPSKRVAENVFGGESLEMDCNTSGFNGIEHETHARILSIIRNFIDGNHIPVYDEATGRGLVRHILLRSGFSTGEWMVCLVINGKKLPKAEQFIEALTQIDGMKSISINVNTDNTNVVMGKTTKLLWGSEYITDMIGDIRFRISPVSFYQVNPGQTRKLYQKALDYAGLTGNETVWDLYCGIGTISLFLAQKAGHVYGVEINPQAIRDAKENAKLNGIENVTFYTGAAEDFVPGAYNGTGTKYLNSQGNAVEQPESSLQMPLVEKVGELPSPSLPAPDIIVVDPPRKGCDPVLIDTLLKAAPKCIVYVSCDPATLARDIALLRDGGYELQRFCGCDMFSQSGHIETVCLLSRKVPV